MLLSSSCSSTCFVQPVLPGSAGGRRATQRATIGGVGRRQLAVDHLLGRVARECARAQEPLRLLERVSSLVRGVVPYAAAGWLLVDPETLLINGVHAESVP